MTDVDVKRGGGSGVAWTALGAGTGALSQVLIVAAVAYLLSPSAAGEFAIALFVIGFCTVLFPLGADYAVVSAKRISASDIKRLLGAAAGLFGVCCFGVLGWTLTVAPSNTFGVRPELVYASLFCGLAESVFLIIVAVRQRYLEYKALEIANISKNVSGLFISIIVAICFKDVIVVIAARAVAAVIGVVVATRGIKVNAEDVGSEPYKIVSKFSRDILFKNIIGYLSLNTDVLVAGPRLGVSALGLYDFGRRMVAQPRNLVGMVVFKFCYPLFTSLDRIENLPLKERMFRRAYMASVKASTLVGFPVVGAIAVGSPGLIPALFGPEWSGAVMVTQIFAATALVQIIGNNLITAALTARGHSRAVLMAEVYSTPLRVAILYVASAHGINVVAATVGIFIVAKLFSMQFLLNRVSNLTFIAIGRAVIVPAFASVLSFGFGSACAIPFSGVTKGVVAIFIFLLAYSLITLKWERRYISGLARPVLKLLKGR